MVKRIGRSGKDQATLEKLLKDRQVVESSQPRDYRNKVVVKPWGYEFLIFENEYVAAWFLHIRKGHSTSMHCHPGKKTSLILLSGKALCNTFEHRNYLNGMDAVIIEPGVFHSTQSLSLDGISLIEVETPPNKTDLVRLNDEYGRESRGYEGHSEMQTDGLDRFGFFCFDEKAGENENSYVTPGFTVTLEAIADDASLASRVSHGNGAYHCLCNGQLLDATGSALLGTGDVESGEILSGNILEGMKISGRLYLLTAKSRI